MNIIELHNSALKVLEGKKILKIEYQEMSLRNELPEDYDEGSWAEYHFQTYCLITCDDGNTYKMFVWSRSP